MDEIVIGASDAEEELEDRGGRRIRGEVRS
jgi:hypothetical protein